jgi:hypothetical protein
VTHSTSITPQTLHLVSTGDDTVRLDRMEQGFQRVLGSAATILPMRLGHVSSLRIAYYNAARLIGDPNALLMFVHQDVEPVTGEMLDEIPVEIRRQLRPLMLTHPGGPLWWRVLRQLATSDSFGVAGVAGSRELELGKAWWQHENLSGMVLHRRNDGIRVNAYGKWSRVVTVDGMCMICKARTLLECPPINSDKGHFHYYDHDLCISAHERKLKNWTIPLILLHDSGGAAVSDQSWQEDQAWFEDKHRDVLPAVVDDETLPELNE